jgi:uncharacterized OB-fold protein
MGAPMAAEGGGLHEIAERRRSTVITKILNFSPNRPLRFSPSRDLAFDPDRGLAFDPGRRLVFDPWRGVPFGKVGVFFRGYVCPSCRRVTLPGAKNCAWCEATFDEPLFYIREDIAQDIKEWQGKVALAKCSKCGMKSPTDAKFCIECGVGIIPETSAVERREARPVQRPTTAKATAQRRRAQRRVVR